MQRSTRARPILRWLLQLDKPVPVRTEAEVIAERDQNYNWNFAVNLADVSSFWFGLSFISFATVVPLFISKLTDNPIAIGRGGPHRPRLVVSSPAVYGQRHRAFVEKESR